MAYLHPDVYDKGLEEIQNGADVFHLCNAEPTTYAEATSTYTVGNKTLPALSAPMVDPAGGRKIQLPTLSNCDATANDDGTHWALVDTATSRLLAAGSLNALITVVSGGQFHIATWKIQFDAVTEI